MSKFYFILTKAHKGNRITTTSVSKVNKEHRTSSKVPKKSSRSGSDSAYVKAIRLRKVHIEISK